MFMVRGSHGRALYSPLLVISRRSPFSFSTTCRRPAAAAAAAAAAPLPKPLEKNVLIPHGPVAEQLVATGTWDLARRTRKSASKSPTKLETSTAKTKTSAAKTKTSAAKTKTSTAKKRSSASSPKPSGDKTRVNVVGEKLCDDILSYVGKSLQRHRGCDLLDIYPGAGLWSSKLHQFLQPRSHVLLEPDAELYRPFLQPLLDLPGTTLIPKSGIIWRELTSVLTSEILPHQTIPDDLNARNDTLLVTANLAFHPKKSYLNFHSIASLVLHQFVSAIRKSGLFQRYGLVRMLVWIHPDDKLSFIPRNVQRRRRQALENDLVCEWVEEICGEGAVSGWYAREDAINHASLVSTIKRMRAAKLEIPAGREPEGYLQMLEDIEAKKPFPVPGKDIPTIKRAYHDVLADLQAANAEQGGLAEDSNDLRAMNLYRWRANSDVKKAARILDRSKQLDKIIALRKSKRPNPEKIAKAELEWDAEMREIPKTIIDEFVTYKDNLHAFREKPPLLEWDRRKYEPMVVHAEEFFPNIHCSLLDIQPRAPHPLLRQTGPGSNRAADMFDIILSTLMHAGTQSLGPTLDSLWPGAQDYILPRWTSLQELPQNLRHAEPSPRLLNTQQLEELLELWMEWPFRPEFHELVGRTHDEMPEKHQ
ncbi:hypothetical protein F4859DRAFT_468268 [Xylaria cf. heliscus]|nr:hypothetical protein F4859DRAFT_468268 [Xylaria cf. heliscus]